VRERGDIYGGEEGCRVIHFLLVSADEGEGGEGGEWAHLILSLTMGKKGRRKRRREKGGGGRKA